MEKTIVGRNSATEDVAKNLGFSYQELIELIVRGVRTQAEKVHDFAESQNGCIRIGILPLCEEAESWIGGGLSRFPEDTCLREFNYAIFPGGGSRTIQWQDPKGGHAEPVNCYGYSALKTAGLMHRRRCEADGLSFAEQKRYLTEENGFSTHEGALDVRIGTENGDFVWLYVCVSGASSHDDRRCAFQALLEARRLMSNPRYGIKSWTIRID